MAFCLCLHRVPQHKTKENKQIKQKSVFRTKIYFHWRRDYADGGRGLEGGSEKSGELQVERKQAGVCGVAVLSWCISPNSPMNIYSTGVQAVNTRHYHFYSPTRPGEKVAPYFHSARTYKLILPWTVITAAWLLFYQHQSLKWVCGNQGWLQLRRDDELCLIWKHDHTFISGKWGSA